MNSIDYLKVNLYSFLAIYNIFQHLVFSLLLCYRCYAKVYVCKTSEQETVEETSEGRGNVCKPQR